MTRIPKEITREYILQVVTNIKLEDIPKKNRSTKYDLEIGKDKYPPKYIISKAYELATGIELPCKNFTDDEKFRADFERLGFIIVTKTQHNS
jgi:hypothetical protein